MCTKTCQFALNCVQLVIDAFKNTDCCGFACLQNGWVDKLYKLCRYSNVSEEHIQAKDCKQSLRNKYRNERSKERREQGLTTKGRLPYYLMPRTYLHGKHAVYDVVCFCMASMQYMMLYVSAWQACCLCCCMFLLGKLAIFGVVCS